MADLTRITQPVRRLICRLIGHDWHEEVLWIVGQRCSAIQCERCWESPDPADLPKIR